MASRRTQITKYRITAPWRHSVTKREIFCIDVFVVGAGWCGLMNDGAVVSFETRTAARKYIAKMRAERTPKGFKRRNKQDIARP
jgi:hypothetical protein